MESVEFSDAQHTTIELQKSDSEIHYGQALSDEEAIKLVPEGEGGLIWHAIVIPDDFIVNGKLINGLNERDFNFETEEIKPRRGSLPVTQSQLFSSLTKVPGTKGPRYIFNGILNGWPGLRHFELLRLEKKRSLGRLSISDYFNNFQGTWSQYWSAEKDGINEVSPAIHDPNGIFRATLRGPPWSGIGYSKESPGFVFWYEAQNPKPSLTYGKNIERDVGDGICTMVHMINHRYFLKKESPKDLLTYHSIVLLEWDHGNYCTVIEGAWLNGLSGYKGVSNWYDNQNDGVTALYKAFPPELISPWLPSASEIRCLDVEAKSFEEFQEYIQKYVGSRFLDPRYTFSHPARLSYRSKSNIARYLLNYVNRDCSYSEFTRNCQTLAADLCSFLAGKKDVVPYHPINRIDYHNRSHFFLYESNLFSKKDSITTSIRKSFLR